MTAAPESRALKVGTNVLWNLLQYGAGKLTTLISTVILARLLAPEAFGIVALAMLAINLFDHFKDLGVGPALVQLNRPWSVIAPTGLALTVGTSVLFSLLAAIFAPALSVFLGSEELTPIIRALALSLLISGLAVLPDSALRRRLQFRSRTIPEISGVGLKAVVSIALALAGFGAWSLVWGQVVASFATTLVYWIIALRGDKSAIRFGWSKNDAQDLLSFGGWVSGVAVLSLILGNIDYFVIGRRLGTTELGYYTMAFRLPEMLIFGIGMVIGQVLFASFSRLQSDATHLGRVYLTSTSVVSALMVPAAVGLSAAADPIVLIMLGEQYAPATGALALLAIRAAVSAVSIYAGEAFKAVGRADILMRIAVVQVVIVVPAFWVAAGHSIYAVAATFVAQTMLFALVQLHILRRMLRIAGRDQWALTWPTLIAAAVMWVAVRLTLAAVPDAHAVLRLAIAVVVGVTTYGLLLRVLSPVLFDRLVGMVRRRSLGLDDPPPPAACPSSAGGTTGGGHPSAGAASEVTPRPEEAPQPPIRVLHVLDSYAFGGAENLVAELAQFRPQGMALRVASLAPESAGRDQIRDRLDAAGLRPFYFQVPKLIAPWGFVRMVRRLREGDVDVVHAHLGYSATLLPLAARLAGLPCVATLHVMPTRQEGRERFKERLSIRSPQRWGRLVFVSQAALDAYAARYGPATGSWRMIHNGIDVRRFETPGRHRPDTPVWAVVAALREEKGHLDLLAAWSEVVATIPEARLIIAGDGPFEARIRDEIRARGLEPNVVMVGRCEDVPGLLATVTGVVSASHTEALPTALIEAAAAGLPTVATDVGGTAEVVRHRETGLLVPAHDPKGLAQAVLRVHSEPDLAERLGRTGRARAQAEFSLAAWAEALLDLYRDVMSHRRGGRRGNDKSEATLTRSEGRGW